MAEPWQFWNAQQIGQVSGCPAVKVLKNWPLIADALERQGDYQREVAAAIIATVAIETASTFEPVREAFWLSEDWRRANLRYYPWYGRGYLQLTWEENYRTYGQAIGVDLLSDPDRAMDPAISANVLAAYVHQRGVAEAARARNWTEVRRRVQGGTAGLDRLVQITDGLLAIEGGQPVADVTPILQRVIELGRLEIGKRYAGPVIGEPDSFRWGNPGWDCSSFVSAMYDRATNGAIKLTAYTESAYTQCEWMQQPQAGDIVFYHYSDDQGIHWPHMGIWLSPTEVLDARFAGGHGNPNSGVGVHPHVTPVGPDAQGRYRQTMRPKGLANVVVSPPPVVTPPVEDPRDALIADLKRQLDEERTKLGVLHSQYAPALTDLAKAIAVLEPGS